MFFSREIFFDFARLGVVFIHLIACCVAIGVVLTSDVKMVQQLRSLDPAAAVDREHLVEMQRLVVVALVALWISGAALVILDVYLKGLQYMANPKIQAKIGVVAMLTLNGVLLHHRVLPWMKRTGSLLKLSFGQTVLAVFAGSVSAVSWFYAALLGIGRPLSWKYSLLQLVAFYPALILGGFVAMMSLALWSKSRISREHKAFQPTDAMSVQH